MKMEKVEELAIRVEDRRLRRERQQNCYLEGVQPIEEEVHLRPHGVAQSLHSCHRPELQIIYSGELVHKKVNGSGGPGLLKLTLARRAAQSIADRLTSLCRKTKSSHIKASNDGVKIQQMHQAISRYIPITHTHLSPNNSHKSSLNTL